MMLLCSKASMVSYMAPSLMHDDYGYNSFFDNMTANDLYEESLAPALAGAGLVAAMSIRSAQEKELERQVKKYGEDELAPTLKAYDGMQNSMLPAGASGESVDGSTYKRALILKDPNDKTAGKRKKKDDPTYRLREHLFHGKKVSALNKARNETQASAGLPARES
eukprot:COSAG05_NODE_1450_length_4858_cov_4.787560_5_plen_165_part_00